jgi:hypothetical protein
MISVGTFSAFSSVIMALSTSRRGLLGMSHEVIVPISPVSRHTVLGLKDASVICADFDERIEFVVRISE